MAGFTAGTISYWGLVKFFGNASEKTNGIMTISNSADWLTRTTTAISSATDATNTPWSGSDGPTFPSQDTSGGATVANEWWSVWNYLKYGVGAVLVGATGSVINTQFGYTYSALHESPDKLSVLFSAGNTHSSDVVGNIAANRGDVFAVIGATGSIPTPYSTGTLTKLQENFGVTFAGITGHKAGTNIIYVANRKRFFMDWKNTGYAGRIGVMDTSSDVAGLIGRQVRADKNWNIPSGFNKGNIINSVGLLQTFTSTDQKLMQDYGINMIVSYPGKGHFFMGNSTGAGAGGGEYNGARSYMNVVSLINYIKTEINSVALEYLYEPNTEASRATFKSRAETVLEAVERDGAISDYSVYLDPSKNTGMTFSASISITPVAIAEAVTLEVVNNGATVETFVI